MKKTAMFLMILAMAAFFVSCADTAPIFTNNYGIFERKGKIENDGNHDLYRIGKILAYFSKDITFRVPSFNENYGIYELGSLSGNYEYTIDVYVDNLRNFRCVFRDFRVIDPKRNERSRIDDLNIVMDSEFSKIKTLLNSDF